MSERMANSFFMAQQFIFYCSTEDKTNCPTKKELVALSICAIFYLKYQVFFVRAMYFRGICSYQIMMLLILSILLHVLVDFACSLLLITILKRKQ
jgi:hypothetical protein